jgi:GTP:adenosylcobinamide-phosphate guanylyltransferase
MKKFHVILLAGGEKGPLFETTGYVEKALIPIRGKPMLAWVIEAFRASQRVDQIVVVGSANLDKLEAMTHVRKRLFTGVNIAQNLLHAVTYVKHRLYRGAKDHDGYIISFCDAVFLTPEVIDDTLQAISELDGDIVLHYVEKASFERANLPTERTYIPVRGKDYTGSTIYYVRKLSKLLAAIPKFNELRKYRKDPQKMLGLIGAPNGDLAEIERALSRSFGVSVQLRVSEHARLGIDVDKPSDLELARLLLQDD